MTRHIVQEANEATDGRRTAPAATRNTAPIIETLEERLPPEGRVLEVASGTGQHAAAFAAAFPALHWTPSDADAEQRASIDAWRRASRLPNLAEPLAINVAMPWPTAIGPLDVVLAINLLHLIPEASVSRLFEYALEALCDRGRIIIYGPFLRGASYATDGDRAFDASLRARDPAIGYKSVEAVSAIASSAGFTLIANDAMPASNLLITFTIKR